MAPVSEPLKAALRRLDVRPPVRPIVSNVTGEFYPADADAADDARPARPAGRLAGAVRQRACARLYDAGARVFVEVGPKKALHGFVEDVLGAPTTTCSRCSPTTPSSATMVAFNQALCGLYAAGLGFAGRRQSGRRRRPSPSGNRSARTAMNSDRYAELGRLFADVHRTTGTCSARWPSDAEPGPQPPARPHRPSPSSSPARRSACPASSASSTTRTSPGSSPAQQFIDTIPHRLRRAMVDQHITRLVKRESGDPTFETIDNEADVIKLAGRHAPFDVVAEFGVDAARDAALDTTTRLAIGAGFDALRDAGIPLVMHYKTTTLGTQLPDRWGLPDALRDDTGIVFASAFPGLRQLRRRPRALLHRPRPPRAVARAGGAYARGCAATSRRRRGRPAHRRTAPRARRPSRTSFDRRFLFRVPVDGPLPVRRDHRRARARTPRSTPPARAPPRRSALAEDWIRAGRCRRVVVVSADDVTSDNLLPWIGSGFLASGAAATDDIVEDAATPFDRRRHGMIIGMGAAAFVVESADAARERGMQPICEVLGAVTANSAFHGTRLDVDHIGQVMERARPPGRGARRRPARHRGRDGVRLARDLHPGPGRQRGRRDQRAAPVFGADADSVVITNTKGFTGHAMGAGIEDVVAIKALETGIVPPVPNFKEPDPELGQLNLSTGGAYPVRYALRLAAGFGSQIAMALLRWTPTPDGAAAHPASSGTRTGSRTRPPGSAGWTGQRLPPAPVWRSWPTAAGWSMSGRRSSRRRNPLHRRRSSSHRHQSRRPAPVRAAGTGSRRAGTVRDEPAQPALVVPAGAHRGRGRARGRGVGRRPGDEVTGVVVQIVSELTGYPPDLLDLDLDLEADLGVDTVKQAEVFAAVRERFGVARDDEPAAA